MLDDAWTIEPLTGREKQILDLMTLNLNSREIGLQLGLSSRTVDNHCISIIRKLGATDRFDAARMWKRGDES